MYLDEIPDIQEVRLSLGRKTVDQRAKHYVIYCRRSEEDDDRKSIPAQLDMCIALAEREGLHVIGLVQEEQSARKPDRPKFNNLIQAIKGKEELKYLEKLP